MFNAVVIAGAALLMQAPAATTAQSAAPRTISVTVTGSGRPMVLIPGYLSSAAVWDGVVAHYRDAWQCHVVSVRGFAGVEPVPGETLARVRDDIVAYIRERRLNKPVLVGHSMGGVLAMWIAAREPDLVSAVISVDGAPFLPALQNAAATPESTRPQAENLKKMYAGMSPEQLAQLTRMSLTILISDPAHIDEATAWARQSDPATAAALLVDLMTTDLRPEMARITAPTLLIAAVKAFATNPAMLQSAIDSYKGQMTGVRRLTFVPATTRHFVMFDDLPFLLQTVDTFLAAAAK